MTRSSLSKEKAEFNGEILKALLKLPGNKYCSDCKRNDHPRWASWSLGVFLCIRCSGVHRSMGTHISRVKSVDLDAWTDEQLENMVRWGNTRANKYWEAKLIPGHIPSENKIENYIRTKYESKRWVMDGPIPDPSTLDKNADSEIFYNILNNRILEKKQNLSTTFNNLTSQTLTKDSASNNLFCFPEKESILLCYDTLSESNLKNCINISKLDLSIPGTQAKTSEVDLKASILSLYSTAPSLQSNSSTNHSTVEPSLHETWKTSKHELKLSNSLKDISEDLKGLEFSEKKEVLNTSESYSFSNPSVSYLLNTQKLSPVFTSFNTSASKNKTSEVIHNHVSESSGSISSSNCALKSENISKENITEPSKILQDSVPDFSIKQWENDSLAFSDFQSPSLILNTSDTLSLHTSPWSTDKPKETNNNFNDYQITALHNQDINDKNSLFYDSSIISTTDVWK
ncbi:uncharacterized protein T551_03056 [Pneumocystis jirovecii RU7]|uniref:Arf-GAP domain-containing protein n=1 Tax=Pneumocystis jirovecii (strain RU7) TaxID=1408657 RepID=A0A0W4ZGS7_PNEJ7|nr:uncharacterized protein T551_03056 [Pneumocystis jirovecii RU7]KTW27557.1 hypothetical protein T551_03056 [Pneumocystis jirovecii RU7]